MRNQGALRPGACASSTRLDSAGGAGAVVGEAKRTRAPGNPNEPERGGSAGGLAFVATCANETRARGGIRRSSARGGIPERTRGVRVPNEPEPCALSERTRAG